VGEGAKRVTTVSLMSRKTTSGGILKDAMPAWCSIGAGKRSGQRHRRCRAGTRLRGKVRPPRGAASAWRRSSSPLLARALTAESDRWFLWLPVLFAGGVLAYFALPAEPSAIAAAALLIAATGTTLAVRGLGLGLVVGASLLARSPQDLPPPSSERRSRGPRFSPRRYAGSRPRAGRSPMRLGTKPGRGSPCVSSQSVTCLPGKRLIAYG